MFKRPKRNNRMEGKTNLSRDWLLYEEPDSITEAINKLKLFSKVLQLLEVVYDIPEEKIEQAIKLAENSAQ
jgi:hypothetical protein